MISIIRLRYHINVFSNIIVCQIIISGEFKRNDYGRQEKRVPRRQIFIKQHIQSCKIGIDFIATLPAMCKVMTAEVSHSCFKRLLASRADATAAETIFAFIKIFYQYNLVIA